MRKLILMAGLIVVGIACGDAVGEMLDSGVPDAGAQPGDGSSMQYVGNSTKEFRGDGRELVDGSLIERGFFVEYAACQETFGPGHRTCTHQEILFTTKIPPPDERKAWYGVPSAGCDSSGSNRATVDTAGIFSADRCDAELTIACCGPK
jgi:hypothetical protein